MDIRPIGSGSSGNAYVIEDHGEAILLDCGLPIRRIQEALGFVASSLSGCLVTHEHGDHIKAAKDLARIGVDIYATKGTLDAAGLSGHRFRVVPKSPLWGSDEYAVFEVGGFRVLPLPIVHDSAEPVAFLIGAGSERLLYVTDTQYFGYAPRGLTHLMVEANYDPDTISEKVKSGVLAMAQGRRVAATHMSIDAAICLVKSLDRSRLREVWLLHLSKDNSMADRFRGLVRAAAGCEVYVA